MIYTIFEIIFSEAQLLEFDKDADGEIDKYEWLSKILIEIGAVDSDTIDEIMQKFHEIDTDKSGEITTQELMLYEQKRKEIQQMQEQELNINKN